MNPLALQLLRLKPPAHRRTDARPAERPTALPPVPHDVFAMNLISVPKANRAELQELRRGHEVRYLRDNGPLPTASMAEVFGLSNEAMFKDLRALEQSERIRRTGNPKYPHWEAA